MRSSMWNKKAAVLGGLCLMAAGISQAADTKWYDSIAASGYLQTSYQGNLSDPHDGVDGGNTGAKINNTARQFDTDSNGFGFNAFLLQIAKPVAEDKFGFTARLRFGQDASLIAPGGSQVWVQEAYATYAPIAKLSVTGGKFVTPLGFEVVDTVANPNYSLGLLFFAAEPVGHTGVKANYVFSDMINATLGVVNGWDALPGNQGAPDINSAKTLLWQVATLPMKKLGVNFQGLYGKELADPSSSKRLVLDLVATYAATDRLSFAAQGNWGQQTSDPAFATNSGGANLTSGTTKWVGGGLWATFAETAKTSTSLRFEILSDENYAGRFTGTSFATSGTTNQTVKDLTISQKYMLTSAMGIRGEYRYDWSTEAFFIGRHGGAVSNQKTVSADWFVTF